jgi:excisionase family DNA binding protein
LTASTKSLTILIVVAELLSSTDVAALLGVSTASVKRWADSGLLPCVRTAGQHRRFQRDAIERIAREKGDYRMPARSAPVDELVSSGAREWADRLLMVQAAGMLEAALVAARAQLGSWARVCEQLGPAVHEVGDRWARALISIADEHLATERLARALARVGDWIPLPPRPRNALLATAAGDEHTLGLSMVELCLRERGWTTTWIGRSAPTETIVQAVGRLDVQLVALSASMFSSFPHVLTEQAALVGAACEAAGVPLWLGGHGAWPEAPRHGVRIRDFASLTDRLEKFA